MRRLAVGLCLALAACPPPGATTSGGAAGGGGGAAGGRIDPDRCGRIDGSAAWRKLHAFLVASADLERTSYELDGAVAGACAKMATELGVAADGDTRTVCDRVKQELDASLAVSVKSEHHLVTRYAPPQCHTEVSAAAGFAAECEASATAQTSVTCKGTCDGTCRGPCDGACSSGDNATCSGTCRGECKGTCTGTCEGYVDVDASQECKAAAEVRASIHTTCSEPAVEVVREDVTVIDATRFARAVAAIQVGLPALLVVGKRVELAGKALAHWADSVGQLADTTTSLIGDLGLQAGCVAGQIAGIVSASTAIQARFEVSIQASASVSASAGAGGP